MMPITRRSENPKAYDRRKARQRKDDLHDAPFLCFHAYFCSCGLLCVDKIPQHDFFCTVFDQFSRLYFCDISDEWEEPQFSENERKNGMQFKTFTIDEAIEENRRMLDDIGVLHALPTAKWEIISILSFTYTTGIKETLPVRMGRGGFPCIMMRRMVQLSQSIAVREQARKL